MLLGVQLQRSNFPAFMSLHDILLPVCLCPHFFLIRTPVKLGYGLSYRWHFTLIKQRHSLQIRSHSQVLGDRTLVCLLGERNSTYNIHPPFTLVYNQLSPEK